MSGSQRIVLGAWLAMIGLSVVRSVGQKRGLPQPNIFLASGVLFTGYLAAAGIGPLAPLMAVFAVGTDIAAVALPYFKGQTTGPLDTLATQLDKISGGPSVSAPGSSPGGAPSGTLSA